MIAFPERNSARPPGSIGLLDAILAAFDRQRRRGVSMEDTPASLLERLRRPGDQAAWVRFVQLYTPLIFQWAHRLGVAEADAADLVQDIFATLVQKLPDFTYDRDRRFRGWL